MGIPKTLQGNSLLFYILLARDTCNEKIGYKAIRYTDDGGHSTNLRVITEINTLKNKAFGST